MHTLIKQHDMTKACYYTMTILIRQMLDYAVDPLGIIVENPLNSAPLTIVLGFLTGLRLGEMAAIKETDIIGTMLYVQRMEEEVYDYSDLKHIQLVKRAVVDSTKTDAGVRQVPLTPQALKIIEAVKVSNQINGWYDNGFLFLNKGERMTTRTIKYRIGKYCRKCDIMEKSFHKVRKTYVSALMGLSS